MERRPATLANLFRAIPISKKRIGPGLFRVRKESQATLSNAKGYQRPVIPATPITYSANHWTHRYYRVLPEKPSVRTSFMQKTFEHLYAKSYDLNEEPEFIDSLFAHKSDAQRPELDPESKRELGSKGPNAGGLEIRMNHSLILLPELKDYLVDARRGKVVWKDVFDVPEGGGGIVAGFFTVTPRRRFASSVIRGGPPPMEECVSFSAKLEGTGHSFHITQLYMTTAVRTPLPAFEGFFAPE